MSSSGASSIVTVPDIYQTKRHWQECREYQPQQNFAIININNIIQMLDQSHEVAIKFVIGRSRGDIQLTKQKQFCALVKESFVKNTSSGILFYKKITTTIFIIVSVS